MINMTDILSYMIALGIAAAVPGPGMTALVARTLSTKALSGFVMLAGLILGDLIFLSIAVFGLSIFSKSDVVTYISFGSSLYLCYLAWQFWTYKPVVINFNNHITKEALFTAWLSGLTITLGNPKTIAFYLAILPLMMNLEDATFKIWLGILVPITMCVLLIVGTSFILAAIKVRQFLTSTQSQVYLFKSTAVLMFLAAIWMVIKSL